MFLEHWLQTHHAQKYRAVEMLQKVHILYTASLCFKVDQDRKAWLLFLHGMNTNPQKRTL